MTVSMKDMLRAGVHFGHQCRYWNPKMDQYIFGSRNKIHIINLEHTVPALNSALEEVSYLAEKKRKILFVGTKRQAATIVSESASRCGQYYVNHGWLGGMMTNWKTISNSIKRLRTVEEQLAVEDIGLTKRELLKVERERAKLDQALGGIKEMGGLPDILFIIDTNKEDIAVQEATKLGLPVIAVIDSNSNPEGVTYPIPGNDDAMRAISLFCELISGAVLDGLQAEMLASGADAGEQEAPAAEIAAVPEVAVAAAEPALEAAAPEAAAADATPAEAPAESADTPSA